ncbi:MAG: hypothetical protein HZB68_04650 [Candidatus Aenigmarchaeota archaeon]|nr:hypothetical protein [Candidatus Aenigmarchaeota archaeon]
MVYRDANARVKIFGKTDAKNAIYIGDTQGYYDGALVDYLIESLRPKKVAEIGLSDSSLSNAAQTGIRTSTIENGEYQMGFKRTIDVYYDETNNIFMGKMNQLFNVNTEAEDSLANAIFSLSEEFGIAKYVDVSKSMDKTKKDGEVLFATNSEKEKSFFKSKGFRGATTSVIDISALAARKEASSYWDRDYSTLMINVDPETIPYGNAIAQLPFGKSHTETYVSSGAKALETAFGIPYKQDAVKEASENGEKRIDTIRQATKKQIATMFPQQKPEKKDENLG